MLHAGGAAEIGHLDCWFTPYGPLPESFIIDNRINVASISAQIHYGEPTAWGTAQADEWAYRYPYPLFFYASGNSGDEANPDVKNVLYNHLVVGSAKHRNYSNYEVSDFSSYRNWSTKSDWELPHILAPGESSNDEEDPTYGTMYDGCWYHIGPFSEGTSYSAPTAAGVAARVISANSDLDLWPEKVRATMMVTAQNVEGDEWDDDVDGKDGTGVISGHAAAEFALNHTKVSPNVNQAYVDGMYAGSWKYYDYDSKYFRVQIPSTKPVGKHLRIVLVWSSSPWYDGTPIPGEINSQNELSDMDLYAMNGQRYSISSSSPVEVLDIPSADLVAGTEIDVEVDPYWITYASNGTRNFFYWCIAWTWVKDHAD